MATFKNNLGCDCIAKTELLKAMDTWDKFGNDPNEGLIRLSTPALQDRYVPYVKYEDMVNYVKGMPLVTPQPRKGHWIDTEFKKLKECSICHARWGVYSIEDFDFCPNCGCKMAESEE